MDFLTRKEFGNVQIRVRKANADKPDVDDPSLNPKSDEAQQTQVLSN